MSISFGVEIPFFNHLGFELETFENGESAIGFSPQPQHLNTFAVTHGGVVMTLLDVTMAVAARSVQPDMGAVTIEMKTSFMQPAMGKLTARGRLIHRSMTLAFTEATVLDAQGKACAHATGTFKFVRGLATGVKTANVLQRIATD